MAGQKFKDLVCFLLLLVSGVKTKGVYDFRYYFALYGVATNFCIKNNK